MANWDRTSTAASAAAVVAWEFVQAFAEFAKAAVGDLTENIIQPGAAAINKYAETAAAFLWAETHRPEWARIHDRTKKKRTRKKYRDRIVRAYREEAQNADV